MELFRFQESGLAPNMDQYLKNKVNRHFNLKNVEYFNHFLYFQNVLNWVKKES